MSVTYSNGSTPLFTDTSYILLMRILLAITGGGGGGGGTGSNSSGVVDPVAAPTDPAVTNFYANTATGTLWVWPANSAAWQQIV